MADLEFSIRQVFSIRALTTVYMNIKSSSTVFMKFFGLYSACWFLSKYFCFKPDID